MDVSYIWCKINKKKNQNGLLSVHSYDIDTIMWGFLGAFLYNFYLLHLFISFTIGKIISMF